MNGDFTSMFSLFLVVIGQMLNAVTVLLDKYIVTNTSMTRPGVYAFYVSIISGVVIFLLPFGVVHFPSKTTIFLSIDIGFTFILAILFLYRALKHANATDVIAWLSAISTIATFIFSKIFTNEQLPDTFIFALGLFIIGLLFVGHFRFYARSFGQVVISAICFGLSSVLLKILFSNTTFFDGFFWSRMGNVIAALSFLLLPSIRSNISIVTKATTAHTGTLVVANRIIGGLSFLFIIYAIKLGSVSVINALSSLQFVFIFIMIFIMGRFAHLFPDLYHHEFRPGHILHKVIAMIFIIIGFFVLFI